jgi:hypothetical protein
LHVPKLEELIQPDIERLEQTRAAAGDINYLDAQILDRCDDQAHQVTAVRIEKDYQHDAGRGRTKK